VADATSILVTCAGVVLKSDRETLLELLESEGPRLLGLLTKLTLRQDVAEDLMQDLFVRVARSGALARTDDAGAYVRRVAINLAFEWRRKAKRKPSTTEFPIEPASRDQSPHERMSRSEQYERVLLAASQLSASMHEVFVMRYIEELAPEEIARRLKRPSHQVRATCHKALKQIRKRLSSREDHDA